LVSCLKNNKHVMILNKKFSSIDELNKFIDESEKPILIISIETIKNQFITTREKYKLWYNFKKK